MSTFFQFSRQLLTFVVSLFVVTSAAGQPTTAEVAAALQWPEADVTLLGAENMAITPEGREGRPALVMSDMLGPTNTSPREAIGPRPIVQLRVHGPGVLRVVFTGLSWEISSINWGSEPHYHLGAIRRQGGEHFGVFGHESAGTLPSSAPAKTSLSTAQLRLTWQETEVVIEEHGSVVLELRTRFEVGRVWNAEPGEPVHRLWFDRLQFRPAAVSTDLTPALPPTIRLAEQHTGTMGGLRTVAAADPTQRPAIHVQAHVYDHTQEVTFEVLGPCRLYGEFSPAAVAVAPHMDTFSGDRGWGAYPHFSIRWEWWAGGRRRFYPPEALSRYEVTPGAKAMQIDCPQVGWQTVTLRRFTAPPYPGFHDQTYPGVGAFWLRNLRTTELPPEENFISWARARGLSEDAMADDDADGLAAGLEFGLGLDPTVPDRHLLPEPRLVSEQNSAEPVLF